MTDRHRERDRDRERNGHIRNPDLTWDVKKGLCINGERVILRGACIHHDNGVLGAAVTRMRKRGKCVS